MVRTGDETKLEVLHQALDNEDDAIKVVAAESLFKIQKPIDDSQARSMLARTHNATLQLMIFAALFRQGLTDSLPAFERVYPINLAIRGGLLFGFSRALEPTMIDGCFTN